MKKCLIVQNGFHSSPSTENRYLRLKEELEKRGVATETVTTDKVVAYVTGKGDIALTCFSMPDFVLFLDKDNYVAQMLEGLGLRLFNSAESIRLCDDKMLTHIALANKGVAMPRTIASTLFYAGDDKGVFLSEIEKYLDYPIVVKGCFGSLGKEVELCSTREELFEARKRWLKLPHIYQEYISSSKGKDIRVILVGGKAVASFMRENKSDFRSNVEMGGKGKPFTPPQSYIQTAERVAEILGLDYCACDLLIGRDGEPILTEVNSNAFFAEGERVTGVDVAGAYAEYIVRNID